MRRSLLVWAFAVGLVGSGALVTSCGARSQLFVGSPDGAGGGSGGGGDDRHHHHHDAGRDAPDEPDVDAPPPFDCVEAGITYVYLINENNDLLAFYPPDLSVAKLGAIACPAHGSTPFSMAVDRKGIAYVLFTPSGELFRVSPADVSCQPTDFAPNQHGFRQFGMGFSSDTNGPGETLYVAEISFGAGTSKGLAKIDTDTFNLDFIGPFSQNFGEAMELTGTGDAKLYGYMLDNPGPGGHVLEIDKTSGAILSAHSLGVGSPSSALAFAFWGGSFYIFTSQGIQTAVHRWDPEAHTVTLVTTIDDVVVGAGVSTCAPAH